MKGRALQVLERFSIFVFQTALSLRAVLLKLFSVTSINRRASWNSDFWAPAPVSDSVGVGSGEEFAFLTSDAEAASPGPTL